MYQDLSQLYDKIGKMTILVFVLILSILVFVHELGHFLAAKKAGILVEEFGFGLPPRIWGKKIGETIYSINALPIGGFVRLYGEDGAASAPPSRRATASRGRAYFEKSIPRRLSVLLAGVTMNLLLAIICFSALYFISGIPTKTGLVKVVGIAKDSPAEIAGIKENDILFSLEGEKIVSVEKFVELTKEKAGHLFLLEINRGKDNPCKEKTTIEDKVLGGMAVGNFSYQCRGENMLLYIIPRKQPPEGEGPLGIIVSDMELKKFPWWQMPYLGVREGFKESIGWGGMVLTAIKKLAVSLVLLGKVPTDIAGPVGIFQITGQAAKAGGLAIVEFLGILSVNLAIINILPLPALDGGRLIFLGYELLARKKANPKIEAVVNNIGMVFLLSLMVLITINDILRLLGR